MLATNQHLENIAYFQAKQFAKGKQYSLVPEGVETETLDPNVLSDEDGI